MTVSTVQTQKVSINHVDHVESLRIVQDNKSLWERFVDGATWSSGAAVAGFITVKVCAAAYTAFAGAKIGAATGAAFGPAGAVAGSVIGGTLGVIKGAII